MTHANVKSKPNGEPIDIALIIKTITETTENNKPPNNIKDKCLGIKKTK